MTTTTGVGTDFKGMCNEARLRIKEVATHLKNQVEETKEAGYGEIPDRGEMIANLMLTYRHLEDANMRLGKAIQAFDGGTSVYDKETTVGV